MTSADRGPLKPGDDIPHEWRNEEAAAARARRGVDTSEEGSRVGPTIDGNGEVVEKSRRAARGEGNVPEQAARPGKAPCEGYKLARLGVSHYSCAPQESA